MAAIRVSDDRVQLKAGVLKIILNILVPQNSGNCLTGLLLSTHVRFFSEKLVR